MRISDWSSDVCSSDLGAVDGHAQDHRRGREIRLAHRRRPAVPDARGIHANPALAEFRSEERRVGNEGVSTWRSQWQPYHKNKNKKADRVTNNECQRTSG